jgi:hypothetical protein
MAYAGTEALGAAPKPMPALKSGKAVSMSFPVPEGLVRRTMRNGVPGKGAVIRPTRIYVYPDGHGFLFFKNPLEGEDDVSVPFDGHYDAIVYLAGLMYEALKIAEEEPEKFGADGFLVGAG